MSSTHNHHVPAVPGPHAGSLNMPDDAIFARLPWNGVLPVARPGRKNRQRQGQPGF